VARIKWPSIASNKGLGVNTSGPCCTWCRLLRGEQNKVRCGEDG